MTIYLPENREDHYENGTIDYLNTPMKLLAPIGQKQLKVCRQKHGKGITRSFPHVVELRGRSVFPPTLTPLPVSHTRNGSLATRSGYPLSPSFGSIFFVNWMSVICMRHIISVLPGSRPSFLHNTCVQTHICIYINIYHKKSAFRLCETLGFQNCGFRLH